MAILLTPMSIWLSSSPDQHYIHLALFDGDRLQFTNYTYRSSAIIPPLSRYQHLVLNS